MAVRGSSIAGIGWIVTLVLILAFLYLITNGSYLVVHWPASWWGLFVLLLAYAVSTAVTGSLNPLALAVGDDGRLSLSKAQTLFWTFIVLYAFAAIYANDVHYCTTSGSTCAKDAVARANAAASTSGTTTAAGTTTTTTAGTTTTTTTNAGGAAGGTTAGGTTAGGTTAAGGTTSSNSSLGANALIPINFPGSLLLLLGFSVTSLIAAAGITRSQIAAGAKKHQLAVNDLSPKWLVQSDDGRVDLTRFQVLLWTLVAAGVFVSDTQLLIAAGGLQLSLPDVGSALVLLMGLGQAAYVGGKLVVTPKPTVFRLAPAHAPASTAAAPVPVNVSGSGFGAQSPTSFLLMDDAAVPATNVTAWSDTLITFTVPSTQPATGQPWPPSQQVQVSVAVGSTQSDPVAFNVP